MFEKQIEPKNRALSTRFIQDEIPDRTYYITSTFDKVSNFLSSNLKELYKAMMLTFSLDSMDWSNFKRYAWPVVTSGVALVMGEFITRGMSQYHPENEEYDFVYKLMIGTAILSCSAIHRITDKKFDSTAKLSAAVAAEVVGIVYTYIATFRGTQEFTRSSMSEDYALIASIATSTLVTPALISYAAKNTQKLLAKFQHNLGAQRSNSAALASGFTPVANIYFQLGNIIAKELATIPRAFQLALIADNILYAEILLKQLRNAPALLADLAPAAIKELLAEQKKLQYDYEYNHKLYKVLRFTAKGAEFFITPGYKLRTGDLVLCDQSIDLSSIPISGELVAFKRDESGQFTQTLDEKEYCANLKAKTGEDIWIRKSSPTNLDSPYKTIDLHLVRDGKQAAIMVGGKLNLFEADNFFIRIKPEKEFLLHNERKKSPIINQIIAERKRKSVFYSILASIILGVLIKSSPTGLLTEISKLMFTVFQTMIPFSESFLRESVNSQLIKELNQRLDDQPLSINDALSVVDLCNALTGYYGHRFPNGAAIISDKTGTLTTTHMDVLGLWTAEMSPNVGELLSEQSTSLLPQGNQLIEVFEIFSQAYTNNPKEMEPEEHAILQLLNSLLLKTCDLDVTVLGNNHFRKTITVSERQRKVETFHLGLYRTFGGRLTLVSDEAHKFLVFCGIPKEETFKNTRVLQDYQTMQARTGVLSRDWCIARCPISERQFHHLHSLFEQDKQQDIEAFILDNPDILKNLTHQGTFLIDNPIKKNAEQFISNLRKIEVPVFVATGDTIKAAENIAKVLSPESAHKITRLSANQLNAGDALDDLIDEEHIPANSTVIFSGSNPSILNCFKQLLARDSTKRPVIIFAEMSTEGKGILTDFLEKEGFFVVANGDGSNDVMMMKKAHLAIAHCAEDRSLAPGIASSANLSDEQLRRLFSSNNSFYELFDIHNPQSRLIQEFARIANSQGKPSFALAIKSSKMTFELARAVLGATAVMEMYQQHWFSVGFDLIWLWIAFHEIIHSADLPMDNQNISDSNLIPYSMGIAMMIAISESFFNYALFGESTNLISMLLMLTMLPIVLKSVFSSFKAVQERLYPTPEPVAIEEENAQVQEASPKKAQSWWGSFFKQKPPLQIKNPQPTPSTTLSFGSSKES